MFIVDLQKQLTKITMLQYLSKILTYRSVDGKVTHLKMSRFAGEPF